MKRGHVIAGFALSIFLLGWVLRGVGWAQLRLAFTHIRLEWLAPMAALSVGVIAIRGWRWTYLLRPVHPLGLGLCIRATGIGFLANMLLPARAGEWVRAVVAGEGGGVPTSSVFATVVLDRLVDAFSFLPLMVLALGWVDPPLMGSAVKFSMRVGAGIFGAVAIIGGLVLLGMARSPERTSSVLRRALRFLPAQWVEKVVGWGDEFVGGLRGVPAARDMLPFLFLTALIWGMLLGINLCLFRAFDVALPLSAAIILQFLQILGVSLPSAPSSVGTLHAATMGGLLLYGLPRAQALSAALVYHAVVSVAIVLAGLACLLAESVLSGRRVKLTALARAGSAPGPEAL